jgi:hypothetical protein
LNDFNFSSLRELIRKQHLPNQSPTMKPKRCFSHSKVQMRHSSIAKFGLLVTLMTFCAMKVIIVDDIQEWTIDTPRDVGRYISPSENTTVLYPRIIEEKFKKKLDFLIVVTSDPGHVVRRDAIRQTWGSSHNQDSTLSIGLVFLMGLTLNPQVILFWYFECEREVYFESVPIIQTQLILFNNVFLEFF